MFGKLLWKLIGVPKRSKQKTHLWSKTFRELWVKRNTTGLFTAGLIKGLGLQKHLYKFPTVRYHEDFLNIFDQGFFWWILPWEQNCAQQTFGGDV